MPSEIVWENWITHHGSKLLHYARSWTHNHAEAEDWVQEAFVRLWPRRASVRDPAVYLHRCVRSIAIDASRKRNSEQRRNEELKSRLVQHAQFHCSAEHDEWREMVEKAFDQIPKEQSEVVTLKIWSHLTFSQIADLTEVPIGTVTSRYRYAMKSLRSHLPEHYSHD